MDDPNKILKYLKFNKERYKTEFHIVKIGIFGSFARNEQNENSDIDIIIEFEDNTSNLFSIKQKLKEEIRDQFNRSVDICREKYIKPIFKNQILSEVKYA
jgi:predicted nucleotidyltransferase